MEQINLSTKIVVCVYEELNEIEKKLIDVAKEACQRAYAIYSNFQVGSAILLENKEIISGNNQENAAFPSGICAERTTLLYANSRYPDEKPVMMAIAAHTNDSFTDQPITPCGACRQVILEAENRYKIPIRILLYGKNQVYIIESIKDLLPLSFGELQLNASV
ncbi:MAG: cytidine deaminase [Dysgonamonadaceae bacterium]|jgi:cytidine deaminase|nr:cytidine deaminase [Dysgonamonadaceae bacterium]